MKSIFFGVCIIVLVLSACRPSPEQQAAMTATAQTATAAAWTPPATAGVCAIPAD